GSRALGQKVMENAAKTLKKAALELDGQSPMIVLDPADVTKAAKAAVNHITMNTGQGCTAATRVLTPKTMKDDYEATVKEVLTKFPVGDQKEENASGPLVYEKQWNTVQGYI